MNLLFIAVPVIVIYLLAFKIYGHVLAKVFELDEKKETPAVTKNDGMDYVPTKSSILLGQHFAAIAAVGPIAGPIFAALGYGWMPGLLWVILGAIFIGGVHDFAALIASVRHGANSVAELVKLYISPRAYIFFLAFIWLSLIYVIIVFTDLTAAAFVTQPYGPGVASSSFLYLGLAVIMGIALYKNMPVMKATLIFVPLVFVMIVLGQIFPVTLSQKKWDIVILAYCFVASIIPMWVLLQSRGYLGGFILYTTFAAGILGILFGGIHVQYPSYIKTMLIGTPPPGGLVLFPLLFTTIACGACSGFHGLVSSGTTSKQLAKETDAPLIGYGGMLMEGFVAVISLATVMMLMQGTPDTQHPPDEIYARGIAHFMAVFGIPTAAGITFGKLAFATFIYDTLDVATRLGRYIFQELTGLKGRAGAVIATLATLILPAYAVTRTITDATGKVIPLWKIFWPIFGASNQLLAALTLTAITVWMKKEKKNTLITGIPMTFMLLVTFASLILILKPYLSDMFQGKFYLQPIGTTGVILFVLAIVLVVEALPKLLSVEKQNVKT